MIKIIAHRGASYEEPENTLGSIRRAIEIGVDFVELDVHLSGDGIPVVIHDNTLCRTTNAEKGKHVRKTHYEEIVTLDAGSWFKGRETDEIVPSLEDVLKIDFKGIGLMIEIKDDIKHDLSKKVMELITKYSANHCIVGSFSSETLRYIIDHYKEQALIGIIDKEEGIEAFKGLPISMFAAHYQIFLDGVSPASKFFNKEFSACSFWAWTVNDLSTAKQLLDCGVTGIITNHPRALKETLKELVK